MRHDIKQPPAEQLDAIDKLKASVAEMTAILDAPNADLDTIAELRGAIKSIARAVRANARVTLRHIKE